MGTSIRDVLGGRQLSGTIVATKPLVPVDQLPPGLMTPSGKAIQGNSCTMYQVNGTRKTAQAVQFGSPSKKRSLSGVAEKPVVLAHFKENIEIDATVLINLEDENGNKQRLGESEVDRQVAETKDILANTRAAAVMSAFALGYVYLDSAGNILATSSGAQTTVDFGISASNKSQLARGGTDGTSNIITTSWAVASAKIVTQMINLRKAARKLNGYVPKVALYGANILGYFMKNDELKPIIDRSAAYQAAFSAGQIPNGFLGMDWYPAYDCFYDVSGTVTSVFPDDQVTFIPPVAGDWYELLEGTTPIPGSFGNAEPGGTIASVMSGVIMQKGMFAYATQTTDPVGAKMVYGDTFLPYIKVPNAVYIATTVF